ncbi:MAG: PilZ domain-containing protein [Gemmataceae bacterium]
MPTQVLDAPQEAAALECRVYERYPCDLPAACAPASALGDPEAKWDGVVRDLSSGGMRLLLRRRFEPGTGLAIELPGEVEPYTVLAKVANVHRDIEKGWALGVRFISPLSDTERERLLAWSPPAEPKAKAIPDVRLQICVGEAELLVCRVKQFQPGGEGWPLPEGHEFSLRGTTGEKRWQLQLRVRECLHSRGLWRLLCELTQPPAASRLLAALGEPV